MAKIPVFREDDAELLGAVDHDVTSWKAQTIWGYTFARAETQAAAEQIVRDQGLTILKDVWQYYDKDDEAWHACVLKGVFENRVVVIRTNEMGYQEPEDYKQVIIANPSETNLVKA